MGQRHSPSGRGGVVLEIGLVRVMDADRVVAVADDIVDDVADDVAGGAAHYGGKIWIDD